MNFRITDLENLPWEVVSSEHAISQAIYLDTLDHQKRTGIRTRLVRFHPGARTLDVYTHDYHEEVYLIEGEQTEHGQAHRPEATYGEGCHFYRAAKTLHGPFETGKRLSAVRSSLLLIDLSKRMTI